MYWERIGRGERSDHLPYFAEWRQGKEEGDEEENSLSVPLYSLSEMVKIKCSYYAIRRMVMCYQLLCFYFECTSLPKCGCCCYYGWCTSFMDDGGVVVAVRKEDGIGAWVVVSAFQDQKKVKLFS